MTLPKMKRLTMKKKSLLLWMLRITRQNLSKNYNIDILHLNTLKQQCWNAPWKNQPDPPAKAVIAGIHIYVGRQMWWKKRCSDGRRKSKKDRNGWFFLCDIFSLSSLHICIKVIVNNVHLTSAVCGTNAY